MKRYEFLEIRYSPNQDYVDLTVSHFARLHEIAADVSQRFPKVKTGIYEHSNQVRFGHLGKAGVARLGFDLFEQFCDAGWMPLDFVTLRLEIEE